MNQDSKVDRMIEDAIKPLLKEINKLKERVKELEIKSYSNRKIK